MGEYGARRVSERRDNLVLDTPNSRSSNRGSDNRTSYQCFFLNNSELQYTKSPSRPESATQEYSPKSSCYNQKSRMRGTFEEANQRPRQSTVSNFSCCLHHFRLLNNQVAKATLCCTSYDGPDWKPAIRPNVGLKPDSSSCSKQSSIRSHSIVSQRLDREHGLQSPTCLVPGNPAVNSTMQD
jgi:hypothetical protein